MRGASMCMLRFNSVWELANLLTKDHLLEEVAFAQLLRNQSEHFVDSLGFNTYFDTR